MDTEYVTRAVQLEKLLADHEINYANSKNRAPLRKFIKDNRFKLEVTIDG